MFSQLKERVAEKLKNLAPPDELDKAISAIVDRGTAETLQAPDWGANLELVDVVNKNPEAASEKLLRIINRTIAKPVVRTQVLALTVLDTCVRNCHPYLHGLLAQSLLWADLLKLVQDKSVSQIDLEVRDKILSMVEDYGKYLAVNQPSFGQAYESLVDQGVDFPVRVPDELVPIEVQVPPPLLPSQVAAAAATTAAHLPATGPQQQQQSGAASMAAAAQGYFSGLLQSFGAGAVAVGPTAAGAAAVPGGTAAAVAPQRTAERGQARTAAAAVAVPAFDPTVLEELSAEDRAAVEAAMVDMALEAEAAHEATAIAASLQTAAAEQAAVGANDNVPQLPTSTSASDQAALGKAVAGVMGAPPPPPPAMQGSLAQLPQQQQVVALPANNLQALQVISNSVGVLSDLVLGIPEEDPTGVRDPLIRELADQCLQYRSRLMQMVGEVADEALLQSALTQNDLLGTAMSRYDALLAQALSSTPQPHTVNPALDTAARAAAATTAIASGGGATLAGLLSPGADAAGGLGTGSAGPNFTLIDEEEEDPSLALATRRNEAAAVLPALAAPPATAIGGPLVDLLGDLPATTTPAAPAPKAATVQPPSPAANGAHELLI